MRALPELPERIQAYPVIETLIDRPDAPAGRFSLANEMFVERGNISDWNELHHLHYKGENLPMGPKFWKLTLQGQTIGVVVTGSPKGLLKERHVALPRMKPDGRETKITNTQRYNFINANFRVISRIVVDTMFRGIGAGQRLANLAARMEGLRFMEIQSSMSKFNYFAQKGGFTFVKPMNSNHFEAGLKFFRSHFQASPQDFEAIVDEVESLPIGEQRILVDQCRVFYYRFSALEKTGNNRGKGEARVAAMSTRDIIKAIQQLVLASPMYGIYKNPDVGREIPQILPLSAFDRQKPSEKLVLQ